MMTSMLTMTMATVDGDGYADGNVNDDNDDGADEALRLAQLS